MDDSLEALLEKATNPRNRYEDWEFMIAFCDRVNGEPEGPVVALKIIVPKLRNPDDKVCLLALSLLEACVKNCGQRFHQELGKFRFLNELIRMLSPKYLGGETPEPVQKKIKELLYSWKIGLPQEPKVAEAFEMLKKEGLIFDESAPLDRTLESFAAKPRVTLSEDPRQTEMLRKLLASKSPDDLRAANRLIREMVRRDEKRMNRLQKRLEELELVQNNIKLLTELLSHYKPEDGKETERLLIKELYSSLEKMRPNLFRMASELKPNEEGMADILRANESLLRVSDTYKRVIGDDSSTPTSPSAAPTSQGGAGVVAKADSGEPPKEGGGATGDVLIDLADFNFGGGGGGGSDQGAASTPTTSLLDDLGLLLGTPQSPGQNTAPLVLPPFGQTTLPSSYPAHPSTSTLTSSPQQPSLITLPPPPQPQGRASLSPGQPRGAQFSTPSPFNNLLGDISSLSLTSPSGGSGGNVSTTAPPTDVVPPGLGLQGGRDPLAVLDDLFLPLESIQPGSHPPLPIFSKEAVQANFHVAKNVPAPGVLVLLFSAISTNPSPLSSFQFQAAVPKLMRVKLQPPTAVELSGYNPILPPPSISQVLLLANPTKAKIRLKYRVSFVVGGKEVVEMGEVANIPAMPH